MIDSCLGCDSRQVILPGKHLNRHIKDERENMQPVIRRLLLKNFRSFPQEIVTFANPTFLVGQNGAGKSNLVDAFAFVSAAMSSPLQEVIEQHGLLGVFNLNVAPGELGFGIRLDFGQVEPSIRQAYFAFETKERQAAWGFDVIREQCRVEFLDGTYYWYDRLANQFSTNVPGLAPFLQPTALTLPLIGGDVRFAPILTVLSRMHTYSVEPAKLRGPQFPRRGDTLQNDGGNAASVLAELERAAKPTLERLQEYMRAGAPHVQSVHTETYRDEMLMLYFQQMQSGNGRASLSSELMSDGTLRILGLLLAVFQPATPGLLVLEEPEKTIHPGALGTIMDLVYHASRNMQVIVTTHSPELLDAAAWLGEEHLRVVVWKGGASHVLGVSSPAKASLQRHLMGAGELMRSNALEPAMTDTSGEQRPIELFETLA